MSNEDLTRQLLSAIQPTLRQAGFRKHGATFSRDRRDTRQFVQLQKSQTSTATCLRVRINLGTFLLPLIEPTDRSWFRPKLGDSHWREYLEPHAAGGWWEVQTIADAERVGREIAQMLHERWVPELESLGNSAAVAALWHSGRSPGLTERQRADLLARLDRAVPWQASA